MVVAGLLRSESLVWRVAGISEPRTLLEPHHTVLGLLCLEGEGEGEGDHAHGQRIGEKMIICFHEGKDVVLVMREFMMIEEALVFTTTGDLVGAMLILLRRLTQAPPLSSS